MSLHLITGYAGTEHITSADQGAYNIATFGGGNLVLDRGRKFGYSISSNNSISISDGEAMIQGRFIKMPGGTSEAVSIQTGTQGKYRNDLICIRYEKSASDSTESAKLVVIKGTETTGTPADPSYNQGSITDGTDSICDFPIYRVRLNGINIQTVTALFTPQISMANYMNNYQLPTASSSTLGGVKIGDGINISGGKISVPVPTKLGSASVGDNKTPMYLDYGTPKAGKTLEVVSVTASIGSTITVPADGSDYHQFSKIDIADKINAKHSGYNVTYADILAVVRAKFYMNNTRRSYNDPIADPIALTESLVIRVNAYNFNNFSVDIDTCEMDVLIWR